MIKFAATKENGKRLIGFGISEKNVQELKKDKPILVKAEELGISEDILIFYGETEEKIKETLASFIGPETEVREPE